MIETAILDVVNVECTRMNVGVADFKQRTITRAKDIVKGLNAGKKLFPNLHFARLTPNGVSRAKIRLLNLAIALIIVVHDAVFVANYSLIFIICVRKIRASLNVGGVMNGVGNSAPNVGDVDTVGYIVVTTKRIR